jgi:glucarate dehydratase
MGQKLGVPVHALLGGKLRDAVEFASYLFFRYRNPATKRGEVRTSAQLTAHARALKRKHGFRVHKLKGGVYPPAYELACYRALADAFPDDRFRYDPNSALSLADAIDFGRGIDDLCNDYYEDPVWGMPQLARLKEFVPIPIATNTVIVNFEQLAANAEMRAVDVVLLDTTFWGGIRPCIKAAGVCETLGMGVAVHSSGELGIQLATMLHLGAVLPNLGYAADAHYHHLTDDVIAGGRMKYAAGAIRVPDGNGLGVALDRDKLARYHELYKELGGYPYDRDPGRPGWYPTVPNHDWADPEKSLTPRLTRQ